MRAWDKGEALLREAAARRVDAHADVARELEERGVDLDPERAGAGDQRDLPAAQEGAPDAGAPHDHPHPHDDAHAHDHAHPHVHPHAEPGERPVVGIVGAGAVGSALGVALSRAGWPVGAVASRDATRRERFRHLVPGVRGFAEANALVDDVELVILAVPDDAIAAVAETMRLYAGQAMVHTSGLLGPEVLLPAMAAGTQAGAFHPLVAFADLDRAVAALHGATVAIEGDDELAAHLAEMAEAIGGVPVRLAPGSRAAYHAAAVLAAGGVTGLLDAIREVAGPLGLDEAGSLAIFVPLVQQTIANARALGVDAALTGPAPRGDAGTVRAHVAALEAHAPGALEIYRALLRRDVDIAVRRGVLAPEAAWTVRAALAEDR